MSYLNTPVPKLPVERFAARIEIEESDDHRLDFNRSTARNANDSNPDTIGIWATHYHAGICHNVSFLMSPAMLVHMANTLLTANERAAIRRGDA